MAELDFERRLERLFGEPPDLPDAAAFAERVERRLNRGWTARRWLIGAAGVVGGVIGVSQLVFTNVLGQVHAAETSARLLTAGLNELAPSQWMSSVAGGGVVVWVAAGLAVIMTGFVLTRVIEEI